MLICLSPRCTGMCQFHDYHGVLSLMYLSEPAKPHVMYVAHNADYNGAWALGSPGRERYLYSMFNLPINRETRECAPPEHLPYSNVLGPQTTTQSTKRACLLT